MTSKAQLLAKYATKPIKKLMQYDCFAQSRCDDFIHNAGGFGCITQPTEELMSMSPDARLLIRPDADLESIHKWLLNLAAQMERKLINPAVDFRTAFHGDDYLIELRDAMDLVRGQLHRADEQRAQADMDEPM